MSEQEKTPPGKETKVQPLEAGQVPPESSVERDLRELEAVATAGQEENLHESAQPPGHPSAPEIPVPLPHEEFIAVHPAVAGLKNLRFEIKAGAETAKDLRFEIKAGAETAKDLNDLDVLETKVKQVQGLEGEVTDLEIT